jgi:hypothetical protein
MGKHDEESLLHSPLTAAIFSVLAGFGMITVLPLLQLIVPLRLLITSGGVIIMDWRPIMTIKPREVLSYTYDPGQKPYPALVITRLGGTTVEIPVAETVTREELDAAMAEMSRADTA